jgi:hypothetical protein
MAYKVCIFVTHVLELAFFAGLVGCVLMIILSWIDIFSDSFTRDE